MRPIPATLISTRICVTTIAPPMGNGAAAFALVVVYNLANEAEIILGNNPFAVGENNVHESERNRVRI